MYKVSVVIPVYNCKEFLKENIEKLLKQTISEIEIIIVDDGSTDGSSNICDEYIDVENVRVIHQANGGVSKARNTGLDNANGEYVIFVDGDDYVPFDAYERMYLNAIENAADVVIGDIYKVFVDKRKYVKFYDREIITSNQEEIVKLIQADIYRGYCPYPVNGKPAFGYGGPWNKMVKRRMLIDNGIRFDERLRNGFEDILYTAYLFANCRTISYFSYPVYEYRILSDSLTHSFKENILDINKQIFESWNLFFDRYEKNDEFKKPFYACVIRRYTEMMGLYVCNPKNPMHIGERAKFAKSVMHMEPYCDAARKVDYSRLGLLHKIMAMTMKHDAGMLSCVLYKFAVNLKKLLKI